MSYGYTNQSKTWYFDNELEAYNFGLREPRYDESYMIGYDQEKRQWFVTIFGRRDLGGEDLNE